MTLELVPGHVPSQFLAESFSLFQQLLLLPGVMMHNYHPCTWEAEAGRSLQVQASLGCKVSSWQPELQSEILSKKRQ